MIRSKSGLILHPVRMKIIQTLIGGRMLTVQQMAERLPDVPQATLYRHLNLLLKGGVLEIAEEKQVRGAVERTYRLALSGIDPTPEEVSRASREEHMQFFMQFVAGLIGEFGSYLEQEEIDMFKDGVAFRQAALYLSDEEMRQLLYTVGGAIMQAMANEPGPGRRKRTLATILIPAAETTNSENHRE